MSLIKCPDCGKEISDQAAVCIGCGRPMRSLMRCPECQAEISDQAGTCPRCGFPLKKTLPLTPVAKVQKKRVFPIWVPILSALLQIPAYFMLRETYENDRFRRFLSGSEGGEGRRAAFMFLLCMALPTAFTLFAIFYRKPAERRKEKGNKQTNAAEKQERQLIDEMDRLDESLLAKFVERLHEPWGSKLWAIPHMIVFYLWYMWPNPMPPAGGIYYIVGSIVVGYVLSLLSRALFYLLLHFRRRSVFKSAGTKETVGAIIAPAPAPAALAVSIKRKRAKIGFYTAVTVCLLLGVAALVIWHGRSNMVHISGGTFMMGCVGGDSQCFDGEYPAHRVTLRSFYLDVHDVTMAEYAQCVNARVCKEPLSSNDPSVEFNWKKPGRENHPINGVDWNDANTYCRWQRKRLPTEAEFEYALRGGNQGYIYPWGNNDMPPQGFGNYADESLHRRFSFWLGTLPGYDDGYVDTSPVCTFARNAYGLCDISGNVWEWCADWYDKKYYQSSPSNNPQGPSSGTMRVLRGTSWGSFPGGERASYRFSVEPDTRDEDTGFRCARDTSTFTPALTPTPTMTPLPSPTPPPPPQPALTPQQGVEGGMVHVPGGTFMMGCVDGDTQCDNNEKPRHQVMLSSFYLDIHEVTAAEYAQCVNAGACTSPGTDDFWAEFYNWNKPGRENHPVNGVRWYNADTYCRWQNKRLPTEAEFEYALRGGNDGYVYPWGNNRTPPARFGNYGDESLHRRFPSIPYFAGYDDGYVGTSPVCKFARNAYGLCDMSGNVREWVSDWDDDNYYQSSPNHDPQGPSSGLFRVFRGVGWKLVDPGYVRVSYRGPGGPYDQDSDLGFRCARN